MMVWSVIYFFIFFAIIIRVVKFADKMSGSINSKEYHLEDNSNSEDIFNTDKKLDNIFKENNNPIKEKSSRRRNI